ncbi:hypothetical protein [Enemella evansiae]|uniref:hypothetical protein n=1 Tax=Enemella evansiae TaxID=2016499 RepID=UPI000C01E5E6|nr:hypothetical protein [Enemella evansiae]PFG68951.1 hypothetical protein B0O41_3799 [Propionibacteriaceae bacterium ES.041]TDO89688.1 hypothetical protein C8D81_2571 [Enemella evansiae]
MKTTHLALMVALFLGAVLAFGGFAKLILVIVCGVIGLAVGLAIEGRINIQGLTDRQRR